jgi:hypothetical protein
VSTIKGRDGKLISKSRIGRKEMGKMDQDNVQTSLFIFAFHHNLALVIRFHNEFRRMLKKELAKVNRLIKSGNHGEDEIELRLRRDFYKLSDDYLRINTFLMLYSHTEEWLYHIWKKFANGCSLAKGEGSIGRFKTVLKEIGVNLETAGYWSFLKDAETIRDCILHANGRVSLLNEPENIKKLANKRGQLVSIKSDRLYISGEFLNKFNKALDSLANKVKNRIS